MTLGRSALPFRPRMAPSGTQRWRDLLFLHWSVPSAALRAIVPGALELDAFEGQHFVGLVPFAMYDVRPMWLPLALGQDFLETNVRTYVHYKGQAGVYFFSLEAASRLAVHAARLLWGLPYHYAEMRLSQSAERIHYESRRQVGAARLSVSYRVPSDPKPSEPGTLQHFLLERYFLFVQRGGKVLTGQVHHSPYEAAPAELLRLEESLVSANGLSVSGPPALSHYSPGVDVEVFGPWRS